jgi:hypothetical protein
MLKSISECGSSLKILRLNCCKFITKYCLSEIADTCHQLEGKNNIQCFFNIEFAFLQSLRVELEENPAAIPEFSRLAGFVGTDKP